MKKLAVLTALDGKPESCIETGLLIGDIVTVREHELWFYLRVVRDGKNLFFIDENGLDRSDAMRIDVPKACRQDPEAKISLALSYAELAVKLLSTNMIRVAWKGQPGERFEWDASTCTLSVGVVNDNVEIVLES